MALAVFLRGSHKLPVLTNAASRLMATKSMNSNLVLTPLIVRNFTGFNKPALLENNKSLVSNQMIQNRSISHATIWAAEKILSAALIAVIPVCVAFPSPLLDNLLAVAVVVHMHWGVEAVVVDYIRPVLFGHTVPKIAKMLVYFLSAFTLGGLLYFNYNDVGIARALRSFWSIKH